MSKPLADKYQNHPRFMDVSAAVNIAISNLADQFDIDSADLNTQDQVLNMVADNLARALLNAWDRNHR